jgi:hypothetical protein
MFRTEAELLDWRHFVSVCVVLTGSAAFYFLARTNIETLGPLVRAVIPPVLTAGVLLSLGLFVHFLPYTMLGMALLLTPFFFLGLLVYPAFVLVQAAVLLAAQLWVTTRFNMQQAADYQGSPVVTKLLALYFGKHHFLLQLLAFPFFITVVQFALVLLAQQPDSLVQAFLESKDGLFSKGRCDNCVSTPNPEYICTIAGFGNSRLVRPLFQGSRHGHPIRVTRQLQVCNAFEELLLERAPRLQQYLRRKYDQLQIPVEKWRHARAVANALYLFIKPMEWGFLVALYLFDSKPEARITRQYLPVHALTQQAAARFSALSRQ